MYSLLITTFIIFSAILGVVFRFLTVSGSIAAILVGISIFYGLGLGGLILLGIFFISSSLWSVYRKNEKSFTEELHSKGSQRDFQQVVANGGMAALMSLLFILLKLDYLVIAFCVFIATSNSDTWSSEIGTLSKRRPFSVRTFTVVERGTSGGVSFLGTISGVIGAFVIAFSAYWLLDLQIYDMFVIFLLGFMGNLMDTFLGAYAQALYVCPTCGLETERSVHCETETKRIRGVGFLNNDTVNFISGFTPALALMFIY